MDLNEEDVGRCVSLMGGYYGVMGFILVFRSQLAYSRWWEGGALLQQLRGEWFNAYSSLLAFCSHAEGDRREVEAFQHLLMRLMSILYCSALEQVADLKDKQFEIFDVSGLDVDSLRFLNSANDKCEVTLQWIQRLIVDSASSGVLTVAPPILSRVFQEFGRGIVNLNHVRKIAEFPFPFPWPQMITVMLMAEWLMTPVLAGTALSSPFWAAIVTFFVTFAFWNIHYIAQELECPFGDDANDLPLREMQVDMNRSLRQLLEKRAQVPPSFHFVHKSDTHIVSSRVIEGVGLLSDIPDDTLDLISGRSSRSSHSRGPRWKRRYVTPEHTRHSMVVHNRVMNRRSSTQPLGTEVPGGALGKGGLSFCGELQVTASAPVTTPWRAAGAGAMVPSDSDGSTQPAKRPGASGISRDFSRAGLAHSLSRGLSFKRLFSSTTNQGLQPLPERAIARPKPPEGSPPAWQEPLPPKESSPVFGGARDARSLRLMGTQDAIANDSSDDDDEEAPVRDVAEATEEEPRRKRSLTERRESGGSLIGSVVSPHVMNSDEDPDDSYGSEAAVTKRRSSISRGSPNNPVRRVSFLSHTFEGGNLTNFGDGEHG